MRTLCFILLCWMFFGPAEPGVSQARKDSSVSPKEKENTVLKRIVEDNQRQIVDLIEQLPSEQPKAIVKTKIVYVKVYEKAPGRKYSKDYIPVEFTRLQAAKIDSLAALPTPLHMPHKRTFLQRVFNTNK